ncbi:MAG: hypothetical protein M5U01_14070 [Ardenticatenaceae bacterium]|nr:hypothetical protein [Ardenticatenaceae bacterium]
MQLDLVWSVITTLIILAVILTRAWKMGPWVAGGWLLVLLAGAALAARLEDTLGVPTVALWSLGAVGLLVSLLGTTRH